MWHSPNGTPTCTVRYQYLRLNPPAPASLQVALREEETRRGSAVVASKARLADLTMSVEELEDLDGWRRMYAGDVFTPRQDFVADLPQVGYAAAPLCSTPEHSTTQAATRNPGTERRKFVAFVELVFVPCQGFAGEF